jgi:hypothetical protein
MLSDKDIKRSIEIGESQTIEFKSFDKLENIGKRSNKYDLAKLFASFSNTEGGYIIFGVTDDKKLEKYQLEETKFRKFEQQIIQICKDLCRPAIYPEIFKHQFREGSTRSDLLIVRIEKNPENIVLVNGKCYIRVGTHTNLVDDPLNLERIMIARRRTENEQLQENHIVTSLFEESELEDFEYRIYMKGGYETPYIMTETQDSHECTLFAESFGFHTDKVYEIYSDVSFMRISDLNKVFEIFYSIFGPVQHFNTSSFGINQICYDKYTSYSWIGYGYKSFLKALKDQSIRYSNAGIIQPHHRESAGFIDYRQDFIFYIALQPNVIHDAKGEITSNYIRIGFLLESIPFKVNKFQKFFENAKLSIPEYVYEINNDENEKHIHLNNIKIEPDGVISYKHPLIGDDEFWVAGVIAKNPFYMKKEKSDIHHYLSNCKRIIVNLRNYHPITDKPEYVLEKVDLIKVPYYGFGFTILNMRGDYIE